MAKLHEGIDFGEVASLLGIIEKVTGFPSSQDIGRAASSRLHEIQDQIRKNEAETPKPKVLSGQPKVVEPEPETIERRV